MSTDEEKVLARIAERRTTRLAAHLHTRTSTALRDGGIVGDFDPVAFSTAEDVLLHMLLKSGGSDLWSPDAEADLLTTQYLLVLGVCDCGH